MEEAEDLVVRAAEVVEREARACQPGDAEEHEGDADDDGDDLSRAPRLGGGGRVRDHNIIPRHFFDDSSCEWHDILVSSR